MSEKAEDKKEIKPIAENILQMSERIAKKIKFDKEGVPTIEDGVFVAEAEKADLSAEDLKVAKRFNEFEKQFAAGAGHAVGMAAIDVYKKHKNIQTLSATFPTIGRDSITIKSLRHTTTPNPRNREEKLEIYGGITAIRDSSFGKKDSAVFGTVCQHVKAAAAAALKDL